MTLPEMLAEMSENAVGLSESYDRLNKLKDAEIARLEKMIELQNGIIEDMRKMLIIRGIDV